MMLYSPRLVIVPCCWVKLLCWCRVKMYALMMPGSVIPALNCYGKGLYFVHMVFFDLSLNGVLILNDPRFVVFVHFLSEIAPFMCCCLWNELCTDDAMLCYLGYDLP